MFIMIGLAIAPVENYFSKRTGTHCSIETILGFRTLVALPVIGLFAWGNGAGRGGMKKY